MFQRRLALRTGTGPIGLSLVPAVAALGLEAAWATERGDDALSAPRPTPARPAARPRLGGYEPARAAPPRDRARLLLEERALTDPLTRVANRHAGEEQLEAKVADGHRRGRPLSAVMVDLARFKAIDDDDGHPTGDAVLGAVADVLGAVRGDRDLFVRWGGEEFLLIPPETIFDDAAGVGERGHHTIAGLGPRGLRSTATLGVAGFAEGETAASPLRRADVAVHEGRDRTVDAPAMPLAREPPRGGRPRSAI